MDRRGCPPISGAKPARRTSISSTRARIGSRTSRSYSARCTSNHVRSLCRRSRRRKESAAGRKPLNASEAMEPSYPPTTHQWPVLFFFSSMPDTLPIDRDAASVSRSGADARTAPRQRAVLTWLFAVRGLVSVGTLIAAGLTSTDDPYASYIRTVAVLVSFIATGYGLWRVRVAGAALSQSFLLGQALADLGLIGTLVHYAAAPAIYGSLFVVMIAAYAVLMTPWWSGFVTLLAMSGYVTDGLYFRGGEGVDTAFWVQVGVFWLVYGIVAVLGQRLRRADREQHTLEYELRRVRLV